MKTALAVIGQLLLFLLFLACSCGGSFLGMFHLDPFHAALVCLASGADEHPVFSCLRGCC